MLVYTLFKNIATFNFKPKNLPNDVASCRAFLSRVAPPSWTFLSVHKIALSGWEYDKRYSGRKGKTLTRAHNGDALVNVQRRSRIVREAFRTLTCVDTQFASLDTSQPPANLPGIPSPSSVRERGTNVSWLGSDDTQG